MIITRTPFRISFFGGGTDYPKWYLENGGAVLATSIDKYCYISVRRLPPFFEHKHRVVYSAIETVKSIEEIRHPAVRAVLTWAKIQEGLEIHHDGDLPARSGLGSSSSFAVGLVHAMYAMRGVMKSKETLANDAIHVEQDIIREHVGSQDQVTAAFGGFNRIEFHRTGQFSVAPVVMPLDRLAELQRHLLLIFTGKQRIASEVAKTKIDSLDKRVKELHHMRGMVDEAIGILHDRDAPIEEFGKLLHEAWQYKRSLSTKVSTPEIDALYDSARSAGAIGGKVIGAGGGGFMLLFAKPEQHAKILAALNKVHVPFQFEHSGSRVVLYQPSGL